MALGWYLTLDVGKPRRYKFFSCSTLFLLVFYGFLTAIGVFVAATYVGSIKSSAAALEVWPDTIRVTVFDILNYPIQNDALSFGSSQTATSSLARATWDTAKGQITFSFTGLSAMTQAATLDVWLTAKVNSTKISMAWSERIQVALHPFSTEIGTDTVCWGTKVQTQTIESANAFSDLRVLSSQVIEGVAFNDWISYKGHLPLGLQFECQQFRRSLPPSSEQLTRLILHIPPKIETL